ncbi:MAG: cobyrinate a,c-diamide synthase [Beijerinckiaceae bacterium]|nr:cobyrinate a,c-diamide synthase [Beijerinckiaceae bacterium]
MPPGLLIGAPRSGSGKTTLTLGLLRALSRKGVRVQPFKCGPDYIDTAFHAAAAGRPSYNIDSWSMAGATLQHIARAAGDAELSIAEGLMGLFDGVAMPGVSGDGSSAGLAARFGWPVILVLDVSGQSQSAAAVALGFAKMRAGVTVAGVVLNRVSSPRHERLVRGAMESVDLPVLGALPKNNGLSLPERHLGLVQADETAGLDAVLDALADFVERHVDIDRLMTLAARSPSPVLTSPTESGSASGSTSDAEHRRKSSAVSGHSGIRRIALAKDAAFTFVYPHLLRRWREAGVEIRAFSPLADDEVPDADLCWLPGGYPELHALRLSQARRFMESLHLFAANRPVHGECGGYMVLGRSIETAADGVVPMAGLLGLETSFARRQMHLGYRTARVLADTAFAGAGAMLRGHEFHYATIVSAGEDESLFRTVDASGEAVAESGTRRKNVSGSFFHMIDGDISMI